MNAATRQIIALALQSDPTVSPQVRAAVEAILAGQLLPDQLGDPTLLTMTAAAKQLGLGRTWFWEKEKAERESDSPTFPRVEISPGVFRFRRRDILAFAARTTRYAPSRPVRASNKKA